MPESLTENGPREGLRAKGGRLLKKNEGAKGLRSAEFEQKRGELPRPSPGLSECVYVMPAGVDGVIELIGLDHKNLPCSF